MSQRPSPRPASAGAIAAPPGPPLGMAKPDVCAGIDPSFAVPTRTPQGSDALDRSANATATARPFVATVGAPAGDPAGPPAPAIFTTLPRGFWSRFIMAPIIS